MGMTMPLESLSCLGDGGQRQGLNARPASTREWGGLLRRLTGYVREDARGPGETAASGSEAWGWGRPLHHEDSGGQVLKTPGEPGLGFVHYLVARRSHGGAWGVGCGPEGSSVQGWSQRALEWHRYTGSRVCRT